MQSILQILGQLGATFLAGLAIGIVAYLVGRITRTATAGVNPSMVDHGAWATPLRTAAAAAAALVLVVKCFLVVAPLWWQMADAAILIAIVGVMPTAFRGLPSVAANAGVGAGIVVAYAAIGYVLAGRIGGDAAGYVAAGLAVGGVAVARALVGVPDAAWYAANQPPVPASTPMAAQGAPSKPAAPATVGGTSHYVLQPTFQAQVAERIAGQRLAKGGLLRMASQAKSFFSDLPSSRPLVIVIAGPKGSGRHYLARTLGGLVGAGTIDELEGQNGVAGDVGRVDWLRHLVSQVRLSGKPDFMLVRSNIDLGAPALGYLSDAATTGRTSQGDDWTRAILVFVVDIDDAVAAAAGTVEGREAVIAAARAKLDPRLVDMAYLLVTSLPDDEAQCKIAELAIRTEAARQGVECAEIATEALVEIISSARGKSDVGVSEAVAMAAARVVDRGFGNVRHDKKRRARVLATGAVEAIA